MFHKVAQIDTKAVFTKVILFKISQKAPIFLGYFCKQICCQELQQIAQSGHADCIR